MSVNFALAAADYDRSPQRTPGAEWEEERLALRDRPNAEGVIHREPLAEWTDGYYARQSQSRRLTNRFRYRFPASNGFRVSVRQDRDGKNIGVLVKYVPELDLYNE